MAEFLAEYNVSSEAVTSGEPEVESEFYLFKTTNGTDPLALAKEFAKRMPGFSFKGLYSLSPISDEGREYRDVSIEDIKGAKFTKLIRRL